MKKYYKLVKYNSKEITYINTEDQMHTVDFNAFFLNDVWLHLNEQDKKSLSGLIKNNQKSDVIIETSSLPVLGTTFDTLCDYRFLSLFVGAMFASILAMAMTEAIRIPVAGYVMGGGIIIALRGIYF